MPLPKFATRTGDAGETSLWSGQRVRKTDPRIQLNAEIDFALSALGRGLDTLRCHPDASIRALLPRLLELQRRFIPLMGEVATAESEREAYLSRGHAITEADLSDVDALYENAHQQASVARGEVAKWQLYGEKGAAAAEFYFVRAAFRRAELAAWSTHEAGFPLRPIVLKILNRCGDLFFAIALWLEESRPQE
ncbi:MAG: ATP:cob(I)alamin adenosyltransferase [Opitutales bacterium]